jgi:hypothetical protein
VGITTITEPSSGWRYLRFIFASIGYNKSMSLMPDNATSKRRIIIAENWFAAKTTIEMEVASP